MFEPAPGTEAEDCAIYLLGTVFGMLLHQRGQVVLHASAVAVDGRALLFCGPSGAGKSTMAAALCRRGWPLLGDDFCAISFDGSGWPILKADARKLKLSAEAITALDYEALRGPRVLRRVQKYYVDPPSGAQVAEAPIAAIHVLRQPGPDAPEGLVLASLVEAIGLIQANAYRPGIVRRTGQAAAYFQAAAQLAQTVPIWRLAAPRDLGTLDATAALVEERARTLADPREATSRTRSGAG